MSIFWEIDNYLTIIEKPLAILKTGTQNMGNGVYLLRAGTPLNSSGSVANTGNAKYLVAEDYYFYSNTPTQAKNVRLIETGYIDLDKAEAAFGKSYTAEAKAALETAGIILVDGALASGPSIPEVTSEDNGKFLRVVDGAWAAASVPSANGVSF